MKTNEPSGLPSNTRTSSSVVEHENNRKSTLEVKDSDGNIISTSDFDVQNQRLPQAEVGSGSPFIVPGAQYGMIEITKKTSTSKIAPVTHGSSPQTIQMDYVQSGIIYKGKTSQYYVVLLTYIDLGNGTLQENDPTTGIGFCMDSVRLKQWLAFEKPGGSDSTITKISAGPGTTNDPQVALDTAVSMILRIVGGSSPQLLPKKIHLSASDTPGGGVAYYDMTDWAIISEPMTGPMVGHSWLFHQTTPWNPFKYPSDQWNVNNNVYPISNGNIIAPGALATTNFQMGTISAWSAIDPVIRNK